MDAFKILSRSTKLACPSIKSSAPQVTPSSGEASNPQLFGAAPARNLDDTSSNHSEKPKSKKRKRAGDDTSIAGSIPKDLDFFNDNVVSKDHTRSDGVPTGLLKFDGQQTLGTSVKEGSDDVPAGEDLVDDECKRILRSHKIKITQLWGFSKSSDSVQVDAKKKKRGQVAAELDVEAPTRSKKQQLDIIPQPLTSFAQLRSRYNLPRRLVTNIEDQGYNMPTEVQLGSLPLLLGSPVVREDNGGVELNSETAPYEQSQSSLGIDLLTVAPTGSGKTLAFLIPVLNAIIQDRKSKRSGNPLPNADKEGPGPKALIIAPTKELASQIANEGRKLTRQTGVKVTLVRKGMDLVHNVEESKSKDVDEDLSESSDNDNKHDAKPPIATSVRAHVLVSTPLTLLHAMTASNGEVSPLPSVRYLVLDEADVLLDVLFREQTLQIWSACTNILLRVTLWSATMGSSIEDLAKSTIEKRWREISAKANKHIKRPQMVRLVVGLKDSAIPNITHKLVYAASEQGKLMALRQLIRPTAASTVDGPSLQPPFLVFTQTIPRAVALHSELLYDIPQEAGGASRIAVLHADLSDTARERVMTRFRKGEIWVLITTDLLSRGVDFRGVNGVVNYDFPNSSAAYIHRVGRTGRAGREGGVAVTLYAKEDIPFVKNVANVIAASERQRGAKGENQSIQQWLLDAMPKPSKKQKQLLKKRGVESRRTGYTPNGTGESGPRTRISTKSGFERTLQHNKRAAAHGAKQSNPRQSLHNAAEDDEFSGFED